MVRVRPEATDSTTVFAATVCAENIRQALLISKDCYLGAVGRRSRSSPRSGVR